MGKKIQYIGKYNMDEVLLGKGNFARVELATHQITEIKVAIKVIDTKKIKEDYIRQNLHREAKIMSKLRHPNIIRLYETMKAQTLYCLVLEYAAGGELLAYIKSQDNSRLAESEARGFVRQLVSALHYLHEKNVVHRDLKMENIMLDEKKKSVKLIDFGLSNTFKPDEHLRTHCGSPEYAAPELFMVGKTYGSEVDIWSLGIVIYAIVIGKLPFFTPYKDEYQRQRMQQQIQKGLSSYHDREMQILHSECRNLLHQILEPNPDARIPLCDIEKHSWITKNGKYPFSPYVQPPKDKQLRHQCTSELAIMTGHKRMMVEETVKEHKADELSAMFNMLMDKKKKQRGVFDVDHTYKRGRHDRESRSRSRDRDKIVVKTPDSAKGKEIKGKMLKKGINKAKLNSVARPSSLGTPTEAVQKTIMSPSKRSTPSHHGPKLSGVADLVLSHGTVTSAPPAYHSLSTSANTPAHKQNPNTLAVPSPTLSRPPEYNSNKPPVVSAGSVGVITHGQTSNPSPANKIPFSQRSNPPAKLNMTLDLSVTNTPKRQRPQLIQESEEDWDRIHKQVGASVGIAASSGVRPKVSTSPKETQNNKLPGQSPSKKSSGSKSVCSPSLSSEGGSVKKPLRPSTLWYIRTSLEKVRRRIPSSGSAADKNKEEGVGGIECTECEVGDDSKETLAPKATPEDSLIDFCSPVEVEDKEEEDEEVGLVMVVEAAVEKVPRRGSRQLKNTNTSDSQHVEQPGRSDISVDNGSKVTTRKISTGMTVKTRMDEKSGETSGKVASQRNPVGIARENTPVKMSHTKFSSETLLEKSVVTGPYTRTEMMSNENPVVTLSEKSLKDNSVRIASHETTAGVISNENLMSFPLYDDDYEEEVSVEMPCDEEQVSTTDLSAGSPSPRDPASCSLDVKQKDHVAKREGLASQKLSSFEADHNYDSSTSQLSHSSQNSLGMCPMSHVKHNLTSTASGSSIVPQRFHHLLKPHQRKQPSNLRDLCSSLLLPSSGSEPLSVGTIKHKHLSQEPGMVGVGQGHQGELIVGERPLPNTLSFSNPSRLDNTHLSCEACGLSPDSPTYWNRHARFSHSGAHALDVFTSPDDLPSPTEAFWEHEASGGGALECSTGSMVYGSRPKYKLPKVGVDTPRIPMQLPVASLVQYEREALSHGTPDCDINTDVQGEEEEVLKILNIVSSPEKCNKSIHIVDKMPATTTAAAATEVGKGVVKAPPINPNRAKSPEKVTHHNNNTPKINNSPRSTARPQCTSRTEPVFTTVPDTSLRLEPVGGSSESLDERVQGDGCTEKVDGGQCTNSTTLRHHFPPSTHPAQGDDISCHKGQCPGAPADIVKTSVRAAKKQMRNLLQWEKRLIKTEHTKTQTGSPPTKQANCTTATDSEVFCSQPGTPEKKKEGSKFLRQYSPRAKLHSWKQGVSHLLSKSRPGTVNNFTSLNNRQQSNKTTNTSCKNRANSIGSNKYGASRGERCNSIEEAEDKFLQMEQKWTAPLSAPTSNNTVMLTVQSTPVPNSCPGHAPSVFDISVSRGESPIEFQPCQQCAKLEQKNATEKNTISKNGTSPKKPVIIPNSLNRIPSAKASSSRV